VPRELTAPEIEAIADRFGEGARRSREAGFDAVCLQYAHMYLGGQFLSPWANHRCDDFGGGLDGRLKFPLMVIARVRKAMGVGVPLMVRMNGEEPDGGNTAAEILEIARRFERAGVDALHISIGFGSPTRDPDLVTSIAPMRTSTAKLLEIAAGVKAAVSIPVGTANKLVEDIAAATAAVERGKIDLVGLARPLIADPDLPRKARQHRLDAIRPCIYCCRGCAQNVLEKNQPLVCTVNPLAGREGAEEARGAPAGRLSVLVIGGGPAGLQAALTARECGHAVTLVERSERLGGQLRIASLPPGKARITSLVEHLLSAVLDAGIEVVLSAGPDRIASLLDERRPDAAILATGSSPRGLELAGVERSMVVSSAEVLSGARLPPGQVVIVGGGEAGCEAAEYLARDGRRVTIVEQLPELARGLVQLSRVPLLLSLERLGVRAITAARILRVSRASMRVAVAGSEEDLPFAVLVAAVGSVPYEQDIDALVESRIAIVLRIGDRRQPRGILEAIREGHDAAMSLGTAAEGGTG
jgi:NADPH-dependent 2,4-dienoyl-CoA reductase/sulfur reductase-like enzyme